MIKLKLLNPVGDILKDIEISDWTDIERFKSSTRFILESSDGSIYDYSYKEWVERPQQLKHLYQIKKQKI